MRIERERGRADVRHTLEATYRQKTGRFAFYYQIAADLFDEHPTSEQVRAEILQRYGVRVCKKTANNWINRGLTARRDALSAEGVQVAA